MIPTTPTLIAAICVAAILLAIVAVLIRQSRVIAKLRRQCVEMHELIIHVRREAHSAVTYGSDVGKRLRKTGKELAALTERVDQVELHGDSGSFDRAIKVARQGADASKLVSNFGISRGEAELMSVVHGGRAASR